MSKYIVDASVAVEYLLHTALGRELGDILLGAELAAPELMDVEVLSTVRRAVLQGRLDAGRAQTALDDLANWPVDRISHRALTSLAWQYRHTMSPHDAMYVAAARLYGYPLITADGRLSRASGLGVVVQHVHRG